MAATASGRNNFIKDVITKVRQYSFHGVDAEWEFPATADGTDATPLLKADCNTAERAH
jgi:chitinase